jgi:hypothetical protein
MCSRAQEEPLLKYWFRQFKEEPLRVLIVVALAALVYLYNEGQNKQEEYRTYDCAAGHKVEHLRQSDEHQAGAFSESFFISAGECKY